MTSKEALKQSENMAVITLGGYQIVMPVDDALKTMVNFQKAKRFDKVYIPSDERVSGGPSYKYHIGGELPDINVAIISSDVYVEGIINGASKSTF